MYCTAEMRFSSRCPGSKRAPTPRAPIIRGQRLHVSERIDRRVLARPRRRRLDLLRGIHGRAERDPAISGVEDLDRVPRLAPGSLLDLDRRQRTIRRDAPGLDLVDGVEA